MAQSTETNEVGRMDELNRLSVDFLMLADRAEAINGKLYLMGGAWDRVATPEGQPMMLSFAIGIMVPWNRTNEQHTLVMTIEDDDGAPIDFRLEAGFAAGRPPFLEQGEVQRVILALAAAPVRFPRSGFYVVKATLNGEEQKRARFRVELQQAVGMPPAPMR